MHARKKHTYEELTLSFHDAETDNSSDEKTTSKFEDIKSDPKSVVNKFTSRLQQKINELSSLLYLLINDSYDYAESDHSQLFNSTTKMLSILAGIRSVSDVNVSKFAVIKPSIPSEYFATSSPSNSEELAIADFDFANFAEDEIGSDLVEPIKTHLEISKPYIDLFARSKNEELRQVGMRAHSIFASSQARYETEQAEKVVNNNVNSLRR